MIEDLSQYHQPISDLFPKRDDLAQFRLSDAQLDFYREHGYLAGIRLLNEAQIEALRREVMELIDPKHPGNGLFYEFNSK